MSTHTLAPSRTGFSLEPLAGFEVAREEWTELAAASGNVFLTPEWLGAWWQTFGEGHELALQLVRRGDGSAAAILPLYRDRRPPSALRMIGHTQSDLLGPVCAPEDAALATEALRAVIASEDADLFVGNSVEQGEGWDTALGGTVLDSMTSPVLELAGRDWEQILAGRSSNFRSQMRRVERRLERDHDVAWRLADEHSAADDLELLIELHERRWGAESGAFKGPWGALHRRFVPLAADRGWLRMLVLELDGEPVAVNYNLRFGDAESFYQSGRDPEREKLKLGLALQVKSIRLAAAAGLSEYRFLRGDEVYKSRFADLDRPVQTVVVPMRLRARPLPALLRMAPRLPNALRRRLLRVVTAMTPATVSVSEFATEGAGAYALVLV
ncbi:MAG TPA: GNAT family N-acetyltransferase [Solirubrobacterales bacterium]|nr:GNAT family N-acetyltransferase [Solirubrobacterales bacterium]